jgi:hypothetical protein
MNSYVFDIDVTKRVRLTEQDIDDIMVSALEGGINYWCDEAKVDEANRHGDWGHEQIARGGTLLLHDAEDDNTFELNLNNFLEGFRKFAEEYDYYDAVQPDGTVETGNIDATCADTIVQCAVFGDLVYG